MAARRIITGKVGNYFCSAGKRPGSLSAVQPFMWISYKNRPFCKQEASGHACAGPSAAPGTKALSELLWRQGDRHVVCGTTARQDRSARDRKARRRRASAAGPGRVPQQREPGGALKKHARQRASSCTPGIPRLTPSGRFRPRSRRAARLHQPGRGKVHLHPLYFFII